MENEKKKALDFLHYKIFMLEETSKELKRLNITRDSIIINVYLESFLLHSRNLIDFLENNGDQRDIRCSDFSVKEKIVTLPTQNRKDDIQKYLSHLSWTRVTKAKPKWKIPEIKQAIAKNLQLFFKTLPDIYFPTEANKNRDDFNQLLSSLSS